MKKRQRERERERERERDRKKETEKKKLWELRDSVKDPSTTHQAFPSVSTITYGDTVLFRAL